MENWAGHCYERLLDGIVSNNFSGYDPFDGLNSRVVRCLAFDRIRPLARAIQQGIKHLPFNIRPLLLVPKGCNPKGLALCLSALSRNPNKPRSAELASGLVEQLLELRSPGWEQPCWGYNFRWESKLFSLPAFSPNAIATVFAGEAMLDAAETFGIEGCLEAASGTADFLINNLNISEAENGRCFSYTTLDRSVTHNVNLFVASFLFRAASALKRPELTESLEEHVALTLSHQSDDGAWPYGQDRGNAWVDGIHQGFNLMALSAIEHYAPVALVGVSESIGNGLRFYIDKLVTDDGLPRYFDTSTYPLDVHSFAVGIVVLKRLAPLDGRAEELAAKMLEHARDLLWLEKKGFFAYRKHRWGRDRTVFMRWGQCWMLYALAEYLRQ